MKKFVLIASMAVVFGSVGMVQAVSTGTITFNGKLTANTCDVVIDGQSPNATVVLPTEGISLLNSAGLC
ncbi:type 1 fimbrial protein [Klebsiella variicola]|uniref:type 1 fimbrial protein n=1 Tax=Klebsiella variicola TaxID=244366 RepID=UPI0014955BB1|nr:type 1 fimbrial protein [Klebsiella variicola]